MEQAQREKEKEKKKRSKANKKAKDEKDALTAAQAALDKVEQKAEAVRDLANRAVSDHCQHIFDSSYVSAVHLVADWCMCFPRLCTTLLSGDGRCLRSVQSEPARCESLGRLRQALLLLCLRAPAQERARCESCGEQDCDQSVTT